MAYIETIKKGRKNYYYLTNTVRMKKSFRKVRWFLGKGDISKQKLEELAEVARKHLDEKIKTVKSIIKLSRLDKETRTKLEQIRVNYQKLISSVSKVEYSVIEKQRLIRFTFNTNAIEGSTITLKETAHILEDGISPDGKDLREIYEVENTRKAYDFMKKYKGKLNVKFIKKIHFNLTYNILGENAGRFRKIQVYMGGSKHVPPKSSLLKKEMTGLMRWMKNQKRMHPVELAAYIHHLFIAIHPFIDGNGRTARLLLNYMLMKSGFPPICIKREERIKYTDYLEYARDGNMDYFLQFIVDKIDEANNDIVDTIK
ncbi:Fic family protein [Candidatus Woesearchaeota archaeon]|nr:Fic family protein [Candidatus Woesearchaeota archaeon]